MVEICTYIPKTLVSKIFKRCHQIEHFGKKKTDDIFPREFWTPKLR